MVEKISKLTFRYGAISDVGRFRDSNQDSAYVGPNLALVADGMGGHAGGDVASTITVSAFSTLDELAGPHGILHKRIETEEAKGLVEKTIEQVYLQIVDTVKTHQVLAGMGTTLTLLYRSVNNIVCAHLGDSRAYLLRHGKLTQITNDHTFVQHLVDTGKITEEEAKVHPQKNVVMKVLGDFDVDLEPDISVHEINSGDRWFLCSDGICGTVSEEDMLSILNSVISPSEAAQKLIDLALEGGSTDNCTAVVVDVVPTSLKPSKYPIFAGSVKETEDLLNSTTVEIPKIDKKLLSKNSKGLFRKSDPEGVFQAHQLREQLILDEAIKIIKGEHHSVEKVDDEAIGDPANSESNNLNNNSQTTRKTGQNSKDSQNNTDGTNTLDS